MIPTFPIAALTLKEAVRRKFVVAGIAVCAVFVLMAFIPIPHRISFIPPELQPKLITELLETRGCSIMGFFAFLFAVSLGAGTISGEIERGVLSVIVPKPISRVSIYAGKWLGINLFIAPFLALWIAVLEGAIWHHTHIFAPQLLRAFGVLMLYPAMFSALAMLFSTITSTMLATILPLIMASVAWSEGILGFFGNIFGIATLKTMAKAVVYVVPINPLSRWVERILHPTLLSLIPRRDGAGPLDPPAGMLDLAWIIGYAAIALIIGMLVFQKRDLGS